MRAREKGLEEEVVDLWRDESVHLVSLCVPASVLIMTDVFSLVNVVCEVDLPSVSVSHCEIVESKIFSSFSRKRDASVSLECEQRKKTKAGMEAAPFQSVPKRTPVNAVPECLRDRAPPPPKGTLLQQRATWPLPPSDPMPDVGETPRSGCAFHSAKASDLDLDANTPDIRGSASSSDGWKTTLQGKAR